MTKRESPQAHRFDILYREIRPASELSWLVWHFWEMKVDQIPGASFTHRIVPDAGFSVVVLPGKQLFALGPRTEAIEVPVHQGDIFAGVRFRPGAAQSVFGLDPQQCVDLAGPLEGISPNLASTLTAPLRRASNASAYVLTLSAALTRMGLDETLVDPIVSAANDRINAAMGDLEVKELANALHVTPRHLQRLFKSHVGLSPKQVIRLQRFRSSATNLVRASPLPWARIAAERGFSDQSHLIRDFTELGGRNPSLLYDQIGKIRHEGVDDE